MAIEEFAPAKVNLALHVTGQRADGYHALDSLVVFAGVGDRVTATPADSLSLAVSGPMAATLATGGQNLILQAAAAFGPAPGARLTLTKNLPVAAGIGGGSADGAAALRALARLWGRPLPDAGAVLALGADVPVCLAGRPARMSGTGGALSPLPALPPCWLVLVNPGVAVATGAVFAALARRDNPALEALPDRFADFGAFARWLGRQRNDLEAPAIAGEPCIATVLDALRGVSPAGVSRMSGSGATCFGLFGSAPAAAAAAARLRAREPGWWVAEAPVLS